LLERWSRSVAPDETAVDRGAVNRGAAPVGSDYSPNEEAIRFRVMVSHRFPGSEIHTLKLATDAGSPSELVIACLGLIGPSGVLPQHYTQLAIERVRQKDTALRDFLDMFHHRLASLFFRAWEKYRPAVGYERAESQHLPLGSDPFSAAVFSAAGFGTDYLRGRLEIPDDCFLYYAGLFGSAPPSAVSLERMIEDYFGIPASVVQFEGQWLQLSAPDQSRMSRLDWEANNCLGTNVVAGQRVWGVENRFRLRLGPLRYAEFRSLMPGGDRLERVAQFVRTYVGPEFDFDIQPVLRADEVPALRLGGEGSPQIGWNSWLISRPAILDADDARFRHEGSVTPAGSV
jgi:type VI secretion system protein ImpH